MRRDDLTGQRFGRLVVVKYLGSNKHRQSVYLCRCDCGKTKEVTTGALRSTKRGTKSCGCLQKERAKEAKTKHGSLTHGGKPPRLYRIWRGIVDRCTYDKSKKYAYYGGRGIMICEEWLHDFSAFAEWAIKSGYTDNLTIERINVNGNYCPDNCKWATLKEQANNKRDSRRITYNGETKTLSQWAETIGISVQALWLRLDRGMTLEKALTEKGRGK